MKSVPQLKSPSVQTTSTSSQNGVAIAIAMDLEALQEPLEAVTVSVPEVAAVEKLAIIE